MQFCVFSAMIRQTPSHCIVYLLHQISYPDIRPIKSKVSRNRFELILHIFQSGAYLGARCPLFGCEKLVLL